ncbi:hypothetical protein L1987_84884 [Smallanthus sonchifolius]|uniref:Uncharacterized protein n=1 Tax=Smallanthus sonchifolius TaxID=185202 RepID=A0ACB8XW62_9ASTR|nr:hypothetical protein L1987_84884 [Smallanthus sonchifolius]
MELKSGLSAFVTGGASGIGRALSIALAQKGIFVTVVDFSVDRGNEVALLVQKGNLKFHSGLNFPTAIFVKCDVSNKGEVAAAFEKHVQVFGGLDICINCAGITTPILFHKDQTDGSNSWRQAIDVNLVAVIDCTHRAIKIMEAARKPGVIINMGSAAGLYPSVTDSIYSASKGGMIMFTRSLAPYKKKRIRVNVLCPEFIRTEMAKKVDSRFIERMGGYVSMETLIQGAFELITDESKAGSCLWITNRRGLEYWPTPTEEAKYLVVPSRVNFSSGSYFSGSKQEISSRLPFDAGFEVPSKHILPVTRPDPEVVAMLTSGLTASISLEKAAQMESGKTVLVTAAAGGTGQFAVQNMTISLTIVDILVVKYYQHLACSCFAKLAGNKVVATCGDEQVLKKEFPKGVDIVYESVGGDMFDMCLSALAVYGRMVVIGMISQAGFFLVQYAHLWQQHLDNLVHLFSVGKLKVAIDPKSFVGVESVTNAVEYLHSGQTVGKCIELQIPEPLASRFNSESVYREKEKKIASNRHNSHGTEVMWVLLQATNSR